METLLCETRVFGHDIMVAFNTLMWPLNKLNMLYLEMFAFCTRQVERNDYLTSFAGFH